MGGAGSSSSGRELQDQFKQAAAESAVQFVRSGMIVGLGTGSTAIFATRRIGRLLSTGELKDVTGFATSAGTWQEARQLGIPLLDDSMPSDIDLTIDGADEADRALDLIKGGGGALLREKIAAQCSRRMIVVADESKMSPCLGTRFPLPVEVLTYGWRSQMRFLASLGARASVRLKSDGSQFVTDSGNMIVDCDFGPIADPAGLASALNARAGIVEHGLFLGLATDLVVAGKSGIHHLKRSGG